MINKYLRFIDEEAWRTYATANNILTQEDGEDQWSYYTHDHAIANLGVLFNDDAVIDPDTGDVITPATALPGWHVNWKAETFPADIDDYSILPRHPQQIWAGDPINLIAP